jgi:uncharacterized membrane protein SpoIIM required for sporulation/ABC-type transport system involved in multi-copper enzyme maturation permease subunit
MWAKLQPIWIVTRREMRDQLRDWRIVVPIVVLTLFFPFLMNFTARQVLGFVEQYGANLLADRFIPFLLMIVGFFPITVSLVIALESFAGETERHSIEPLLSSPLTDLQLYLGKLLASLVPPVFASYLGVLVYLIGIYRTTTWRPEPGFLVLVLILTFVQALVMVSGAVVVSTQTTSVRAANLLASFIVVPMALLIQGESVVMLWAEYDVLWWAVLGQALLAGLLVRMGVTHFNREELLGREMDALNLRWAWRVFHNGFVGEAKSIRQWYTREIPGTLRRLRLPIGLMALLLATGMLLGAEQVENFGLSAATFSMDQLQLLDDSFLERFQQIGFFNVGNVAYIWMHNLRAAALAWLAGAFTFAVAGVLVLMLPLTLIGFLAGVANLVGINPWLFIAAFTLPHGLLEIPAILITGAAILQVGATFVTPARGQTIGEGWLRAMADWVKVTVAVVVPLFLGAAAMEVFLTPRFAVWVLGGG